MDVASYEYLQLHLQLFMRTWAKM